MVRIDKFILNAIAKARSSGYVVVYDISSDAERLRVDETLKAYGFRVQYSVFECSLSKKQYAELHDKLTALKIESGFTKLYRIEKQSVSIIIGSKHTENPNPEDAAFIV